MNQLKISSKEKSYHSFIFKCGGKGLFYLSANEGVAQRNGIVLEEQNKAFDKKS
jgi:hypothetical protein